MTTSTARLSTRVVNGVGTVGLGVIILFAVFPILWLAYTSFRPEWDIIENATSLIPASFTLDNYFATWNQTDFPRLILNSITVSLMTVLLTLVLATMAAYSMSRSSFRGKGGVLGVFLAIQIIPGVLLLIPLYIVMQQLRLLDTQIGLTLTFASFTLPAAVWLMKGFFDALPADLENAARVDGCTRFGALVRVVLPLVRPGLAASGIFVAIAAWNDFMFALLLTSSLNSRTWPVGLKFLIGDFQLPWGQLTAATMLTVVPVVIAFAFVGRAMVSGLTAGSLKD